MHTNKMREQFESFAREVLDWSDDEFRLASDGKSYYWGATAEAWVFWQASRAAVVVELPPAPEAPEDPEDAIDDSHMDAYYSAVGMRQACAQFIKAAGLKVTP